MSHLFAVEGQMQAEFKYSESENQSIEYPVEMLLKNKLNKDML